MIKKLIFLIILMLISSIRTSSENSGFLIKELHYYIECSSKILDEDMEEIDANEKDILHIRRGGFGELNKLTISSDETGFECVLNLEKFQDYSCEELKNSALWYARYENYLIGYSESGYSQQITVVKRNPKKTFCFNIRKINLIIGGKKKIIEPVEISEFKEEFISWLKNEEEEDD